MTSQIKRKKKKSNSTQRKEEHKSQISIKGLSSLKIEDYRSSQKLTREFKIIRALLTVLRNESSLISCQPVYLIPSNLTVMDKAANKETLL